jgi:hypothetical protein
MDDCRSFGYNTKLKRKEKIKQKEKPWSCVGLALLLNS